jgi:hypothetical protein
MNCSSCNRDLGDFSKCAASISVEQLGDEYTESFFYCDRCECWTQELYIDRFLGEGTSRVCGPIPKARGDELVKLIRQCPDPGDKHCECEVHKNWQ